ncbi:SAM-dependent methyltransferase [Plantactinospora endophytica]|uniref:SAM-dependent methyltransferase n=1 Tax=Plantactinospora endophytica TaxID=673535 RepID=A0ABQ4DXZ7_9ACTN|nr:methyltransferase domain-containing protein [Plantactinospora endophytica]GIG87320.1 SAM-dependent methyltransferase [Plantactinospora endophytica]
MPSVDDPASVRYARMRWNTPLSAEHADLLLQRLDIPAGGSVLDLGCGWGELLLRAVTGSGATIGVGVDTDQSALARGRRAALDRGAAQVSFVRQAAATWRRPADRVLCLGSAHALGGTAAGLATLAELVEPGGRLLFGDGFWERTPSPEAVKIFGADVLSLPDLVELVRATGWRVLHLSTADQREWDDFESTWRAGRQEWLLAHPDDPRAEGVRDELDTRLREYVTVYRGLLGLGYFVLGR